MKYAKEFPFRLVLVSSIKFTLEFYNWLEVNVEITQKDSAMLD